LTAIGGIAATVENHPDASGDKGIAAVADGIRHCGENLDVSYSAATVCRCGLVKAPCVAGLDRFARRTGENRRRGINDGDDLGARRAVRAEIEYFPHARNGVATAVTAVVCEGGERSNDEVRATAVIVGRRGIECPTAGTFDRLVCGAVGNGRRCIHHKNRLTAR